MDHYEQIFEEIDEYSEYRSLNRIGDLLEIRPNLLNIRNPDGTTPLMYASSKGYLNIVSFLVQKGADINLQDEYDSTALFYAVAKNNIDIIKFLLEKGADKTIKHKNGETACDEANTDEIKALLC